MRAALYLRVSSPEQAHDDRQSIPTQERVCVAVAEARGDEVVAVYRDDGATAYRDEIEHRPAFRRALAEAGARYDRLYVYMLDRFSRASLAAAGAWLQQLETGGAELVSASEWFDESPAGEFTRNLLLSQGRYFSRVLATRVKDALATKAAAGKWVGRRPYGYCKGTCHICVEETGPDCPRHGQTERPERWRTVPDPLSGQTISIPVMVPRPDEALGYALVVPSNTANDGRGVGGCSSDGHDPHVGPPLPLCPHEAAIQPAVVALEYLLDFPRAGLRTLLAIALQGGGGLGRCDSRLLL